ncbi:MAG: hypothetical protein E6R09_05915 [Rhodocyclaceae bacterium]|nr:MAG: hypothetical protein E6R09_05915 [Rhodocyclaceae bacterium]
MPKKSLADALFSRVRQAVLGVLFANPAQQLHLREIARRAGLSAPTVLKEINSLVSAGIVTDTKLINVRLFQANPDCPLFDDLRSIAVKTFGLADRIRKAIEGIDGVQVAFIFGSVARHEDVAASDVDVLVIGVCSYNEVVLAMHAVGKELRREINTVAYLPGEFVSMIAVGDPFALHVLASPRIPLVGHLELLAPGGATMP